MSATEENTGEIAPTPAAAPRRAAPASERDLSVLTAANATQSRVTRNVLVNYLNMAVVTLLGFFATPLLIRFLGKDAYGIWTILGSLAAYLGMLDLGLYSAISRRIAEYAGRNDRENLNIALGTAAMSFLAQGVLAILIALALTPFLGQRFKIPPETLAVAQWSLVLLGVNWFARLSLQVYSAILSGAGRSDLGSAMYSAINVAVSLGNVLLAALGFGIVALTFNLIVTTVLLGLISRRLVLRYLPGFTINLKYASFPFARELMRAGLRNFTISLSGQLAYGSDALIIGLLMPLSSVTYYAIATKLILLARELSCRPGSVIMPTFALLYARQEMDRFFRLYTQCVMVSVALCLPFTLAFVGMGDSILVAWMGSRHAESAEVLAWLGCWLALALPGFVSLQAFTGAEKTVLIARLYPVLAVCNVGLSLFLTWRIGLRGPAVSSVCTASLIDFLLLPYLACRTFGFSFRAYLSESLRALIAPLLAGLAWCALLRWGVPPEARWLTPLYLAAFPALCWSVWLFIGLDAKRRNDLLKPLQSKLPKRFRSA